MKPLLCISLSIIVMLLAGCSTAAPSTNPNLLDQWMDIAERELDNPAATYHDVFARRDDSLKDAAHLLDEYVNLVSDYPKRQGKLHFEIVDESGNRLDGVTIEVRRLAGSALFQLEPTVRQKSIVVNGEYSVSWPHHVWAIELELSKLGYRKIRTEVAEQQRDTLSRVDWAWRKLDEGFLLPPRTTGGPVRIVMPPDMDWGTPSSTWNRNTMDNEKRPQAIVGEELVLVSSDRPRVVPARVRGTYVVADRSGQIIEAFRADPSNRIGLAKLEKGVAARYGGNSIGLGYANHPYTLRLYKMAKPVAPSQ